MLLRYTIAVLFLILSSDYANACFTQPEHIYLSHDQAIDDSEWIARVRLKSFSEETHKYVLDVQEYLKGSGPDNIDIISYSARNSGPQSTKDAQANYFGHKNSNFWIFGGPYYNDTDCKIHPSFKYGNNEYLIFGPKDYNVGFENITTNDDLWLQYVRDYVAGKKPRKPFTLSWTDYFENAEAVVHIKAEWNGEHPIWSQKILKGPDQSYIHMLYISPLEHFNEELSPACSNPTLSPTSTTREVEQLIVFEQIPKIDIPMTQNLKCIGANRSETAYIMGHGNYSEHAHRSYEINNGKVGFFSGHFLKGHRLVDWSKYQDIELAKIEQLLDGQRSAKTD